MTPELRDVCSEERLKECVVTTIQTMRLIGDQTDVFKILNGYENIYINILNISQEGMLK